MSGDIDSRVSDPNDFTSDAPGANDNATGMAGTIEVARILTQYQFPNSIIYTGLSGEEQGLYGGAGLAKWAKEKGWEIIGVLNNDMIGNIKGVDGVIDNRTFRIFSEATPANEKKNGLHPTQKPLILLNHLISLLSNKNEIVLDPFMGSGSTGIAALNLKRKFIGIELNKKYYDLSNKSLSQYS